MTRSNFRLERINEIVKEVLSEITLNQLKDPRVGLVTIVSVRVSPDLANAKVYFSVMGDEEQRAATLKGLKSATHYMRRVIAKELDIHMAPDLRWIYDDSLDRSFRIEDALRASAPHTAAAETPDAAPAADTPAGESETDPDPTP